MKKTENWDQTDTLRETDINKKLEKINTLNSYI